MRRKPTIPRICEQCRAPFFTWPSRIAVGGGRYCSRPCSDIAHRRPIGDRFWAKVACGALDACWEWHARRNERGYGMFHVSATRPTEPASRVAYELTYGPIPDGLWVLHHCDNPPCCNPGHLFLGTSLDNIRDAQAKGRDAFTNGTLRGERKGGARLTTADVREMRRLYSLGGISYRLLGERFGVAKSTAQSVVQRTKWSHVI